MDIKKIGLACDHAGYDMKECLKQYLEDKGIAYKDYGTYSPESCDYPDFGHALAEGYEQGEVNYGIALCGSGEGINMVVNKHQSVRGALCWSVEIAHLSRQHNDANFLVLPSRFIANELAKEIVDEFFSTEFEGGRHERRVNKIAIADKK